MLSNDGSENGQQLVLGESSSLIDNDGLDKCAVQVKLRGKQHKYCPDNKRELSSLR